MSSSGGGLEFGVIVGRHRTSLNFPVARLYTVTSMYIATAELVTEVWVLTLATVGVGAVWVAEEGVGCVSTLTLYFLLGIMVLFLLSGTPALGPGAFLTLGLVLGWAGHGWDCCS